MPIQGGGKGKPGAGLASGEEAGPGAEAGQGQHTHGKACFLRSCKHREEVFRKRHHGTSMERGSEQTSGQWY